MKKYRRTMAILGVFALLAGATALRGHKQAVESAGKVERLEEGNGTEYQTFSYHMDNLSEQEVTLEVSPQEREEQEAMQLLEDARAEWMELYLGDNRDPQEIRSSLYLVSELCQGLVTVDYESSDYQILQTTGELGQEHLPEAGTPVDLKVTFQYADYEKIMLCNLRVLPPEQDSEAWLQAHLLEQIQQAEQDSREQKEFQLPDSIQGHTVTWEQKQDRSWVVILILGVLAAWALERKEKEDARRAQKKRQEQLEYEYPLLVEQFSLLLESGMTIRRAWERMIRTNQGTDHIFWEEMTLTYREICEGRGERDAYERFGSRIGLMSYRKFGSLLAQNLSNGSTDIRRMLRKEAEDALEMRKNRARRLGEEAGTRMLFPMLGMLMLLLAVLLLPAAGQF